MKNKMTNRIAGAVALTLLVMLALGCETTPKRTVYNTLEAIGIAANAATDAACDARVRGLINDADWARIETVYGKFQLAYKGAVRAAGYDYSRWPDPTLLTLYSELLAITDAILTKGTK